MYKFLRFIDKKMNEFKEKRRFKRIKVEHTDANYHLVDFTFWAQPLASGVNQLRDISLGGISFNSKDCLPKDSLLNLNIKIMDLFKINDLCGRIVRVRQLDDKDYEIGVNFSWWSSEQDKVKLFEFLKN
ncbi:MAG: PilZ domain-containing protein [Candidatus Omnitrophica bacterium]|nr:PilZ domain-containing protein [Candidatus Omnitrophota bacterium]